VEIANRLAEGAQSAICFKKYTLSHWLRQAWPIFDATLGLGFLGFAGSEVKECPYYHLPLLRAWLSLPWKQVSTQMCTDQAHRLKGSLERRHSHDPASFKSVRLICTNLCLPFAL
jgi:hypothetical protein